MNWKGTSPLQKCTKRARRPTTTELPPIDHSMIFEQFADGKSASAHPSLHQIIGVLLDEMLWYFLEKIEDVRSVNLFSNQRTMRFLSMRDASFDGHTSEISLHLSFIDETTNFFKMLRLLFSVVSAAWWWISSRPEFDHRKENNVHCQWISVVREVQYALLCRRKNFWNYAVINCSHQNPNRTDFCRFEFGSVWLYFEKHGLSSVWFDFILKNAVRVWLHFANSGSSSVRFRALVHMSIIVHRHIERNSLFFQISILFLWGK